MDSFLYILKWQRILQKEFYIVLDEISDVFEDEIESRENWNRNEWKLDENYDDTKSFINAFLQQERRKRVTEFKIKLKFMKLFKF